MARISRHLCPATLGHELAQLAGSVDVHITHIKPGEERAVMAEVAPLESRHRLQPLRAGEAMSVPALQPAVVDFQAVA